MDILAVSYWLIIAWWFGLSWVYGLKMEFGLITKLVIGWLVGMASLSLLLLGQSWLIGFSQEKIVGGLVLISLGCGYLWWKKRWLNKLVAEWKKQKWNWKEMLVWGGGWLIVFGFLWRLMLRQETDGLYAGWVNVWGDWAAHLSYTTSFGLGDNFPVQMPILAGAKFSYPFLADWLSAVLMKLGAGLITAMLVPSLVLSMLLVAVVVVFGRAVTGIKQAGWWTSVLFLLNGGLGFWWWWLDVKKLGLVEVMKNLPQEYTHIEKAANIQWINIITSQVVPQRGFLLGFPIAIVVYLLLWQYWQKRKVKALWQAGLVTAMLPMIQAHSFVMVGLVAGGLGLIEMISRPKKVKEIVRRWLGFGVPVIFLGIPQIVGFYGGSLGQAGFIKFKPGWMASSFETNVAVFWLLNLGLMWLLIGLGWKKAGKKLRQLAIPFMGLFLLANLWIWQPWEWDNTKLLVHWYLMMAGLGSLGLMKLWQDKRWVVKILGVMVLALAVLAGSLDVIRMGQYEKRRLRMFSSEDIEAARWVVKNTPADSLWLTADSHDHWLPCLTGRKIVLGFKGWLWTYGLDYSEQERAAMEIYLGEEGAGRWLEKYGVDFVVLGPAERRKKVNEEYINESFELVWSDEQTKIFAVN